MTTQNITRRWRYFGARQTRQERGASSWEKSMWHLAKDEGRMRGNIWASGRGMRLSCHLPLQQSICEAPSPRGDSEGTARRGRGGIVSVRVCSGSADARTSCYRRERESVTSARLSADARDGETARCYDHISTYKQILVITMLSPRAMSHQDLNHPRSSHFWHAGNASSAEGHYKKYPISLRPPPSVTTPGARPNPRGQRHMCHKRGEARFPPLTCSRVTWNELRDKF